MTGRNCLRSVSVHRVVWGLVVLLAMSARANAVPPPAHEVTLVSEIDPDASISLAIPRGWILRRLPKEENPTRDSNGDTPKNGASNRIEFFGVTPAASKTIYPYFFVEFDHDPPKETGEEAPPPAQLFGTSRLLGSTDVEDGPYTDRGHDLVWTASLDTTKYRVLVVLDRNDVRYTLDFRHLPNRPSTFERTVVKIVESLRVGPPVEESETEAGGQADEHGKTDVVGSSERRFEMWTPADNTALWWGRLGSVGVAACGLLVLVGLYFAYVAVLNRVANERFEEASRMMQRHRGGRRSRGGVDDPIDGFAGDDE